MSQCRLFKNSICDSAYFRLELFPARNINIARGGHGKVRESSLFKVWAEMDAILFDVPSVCGFFELLHVMHLLVLSRLSCGRPSVLEDRIFLVCLVC